MQCPISPLAWGSKKIQKVVTSTLSAENNLASDSIGPDGMDPPSLAMAARPKDSMERP